MHLAHKCAHKSSDQSENIFEEVDSDSDSEPEEIHIVCLMRKLMLSMIAIKN